MELNHRVLLKLLSILREVVLCSKKLSTKRFSRLGEATGRYDFSCMQPAWQALEGER